MSIIDFHVHAFPDSLAPRAIATLEAAVDGVLRAFLDGRVSSLLASMDKAGIARSVVCPIATTPQQFGGILDWCLRIRSERIIPLASVHPAGPDVAAEVERVAEAGLIGLKLHPMYQGFEADEPRLDRLYSAAEAAGLLVVLHCGYDIAYSRSRQAHPEMIAALLDRHPKLQLVATHMGGWKCWQQVREHLLGRDLWMETSFSMGWTNDAEVVDLIRGHGVERILFGTDSPWADQKGEVELLKALPLSEAEKTAIFSGNARRLLSTMRGRA